VGGVPGAGRLSPAGRPFGPFLDRDTDEIVTAEELSLGLFRDRDANGDGRVNEGAFDAGAASREAFSGWSDDFAKWDDDGSLTEAEFVGGAAARGETAGCVDRRCDELGL
jgi:hypothetical protein